MSIVYLFLGVLLGAILVVFGAQNTQFQSFHFLSWYTPEVPVVMVLLVTLLSGALVGWLIATAARLRQMRRIHDLEQLLVAAERRTAEATAASQHRSEPLPPRVVRVETPSV